MSPRERYVELCCEVLRHTRAVAQAAQESRWEAVLAHLVAREVAMREADRLPPPSPPELDALRVQALPVLQEAARINEQAARRVRRVRDLLRPVLASAPSQYLDTYR